MSGRALLLAAVAAFTTIPEPALAAPCEGAGACMAELEAIYKAHGTPTDPAIGARMYQAGTIACEGGHAYGCFAAGWMLMTGTGVEPDLPRARALLDRACDADEVAACAAAGALWIETAKSAEDRLRGFQRARLGCERAGILEEERRLLFASFPACQGFVEVLRSLDARFPAEVALARALDEAWRDPKAKMRRGLAGLNQIGFRMHVARVLCVAGATAAPEVGGPSCLEAAALVRQDRALGNARWAEEADAFADDLEDFACDSGWSPGCLRKELRAAATHAAIPNHTAGTRAMAELCELGDETGCQGLTAWYRRCDPGRPTVGDGLPCDLPAARARWAAVCEAGKKPACPIVANVDGILKLRPSLPDLQARCVAGDLGGCHEVTTLMPWGPDRLSILHKACEANNRSACLHVAYVVGAGEGVPVDVARAVAITRKLCLSASADDAGCEQLCRQHPEACQPN